MAPSKEITETCFCTTLRRAAREATRRYDEWMKPTGLKVTQYALLRNIGRAESINVTELAARLDLERTAMGRNLDLLERDGLIRTESSREDQRVRVVSLTKKGERVMESAVPVWRQAQAEMKRLLGKSGVEALGALQPKE